jgi:hypothetical protein
VLRVPPSERSNMQLEGRKKVKIQAKSLRKVKKPSDFQLFSDIGIEIPTKYGYFSFS